MLNSHVDIGDSVTASVVVTSTAGVATNPTTTVLRIQPPTGSETVLTYGVDAAIVRDSTGHFHADITATEAGAWKLRWKGTGAAIFAEEQSFIVRVSSFANP